MAQRKDKKLIDKIVNKYIDKLGEKNIEIIGAYIFGSYAKGSATKWSDIDVAIITKYFIGDSFDFKYLLMKIARDVDSNIEPHPYLVDEFNKDNPSAAEILRTGKKIV